MPITHLPPGSPTAAEAFLMMLLALALGLLLHAAPVALAWLVLACLRGLFGWPPRLEAPANPNERLRG